MTWLDLADNPEAVKSTFETAPSLKNVEVFSVLIDREGPTITVEIALNEAPSKPSPRWERINANAVTLKLQMLGVESVTLEGWATDNKATIDIHPGSSTKIEVCIS